MSLSVNFLARFHTTEERRRFLEVIGMIIISGLLFGLSRLETRLFELSKGLAENTEFLTTVVYFGLINVNVVLILILAFLIFRNVAKLIIERRGGVMGSRLRSKLTFTLVFFALAPTILMFYVSSRFITTSFDSWFSSKVRDTMQQTREAGTQVYRQDQKRLESLARIALQRVDVKLNIIASKFQYQIKPTRLRGFDTDYGVESIRVFDSDAVLVWANNTNAKKSESHAPPIESSVEDALNYFSASPTSLSRGVVEADATRDTVRGFAPIYYTPTGALVGVVLAEEHFETQILRSIEKILAEFASLRDGAQLIRISYLILLIVMVMVIGFSTTWLGFYVARGIVNPIQSLSEATKEIASGNYNVTLPEKSDDETGTLIRSFEKMIIDLKNHEEINKRSTHQLEKSNDELRRRHRYMEVILRNITAGVVSVDSQNVITSFNTAASRLLELPAEKCLSQNVISAFGPLITDILWNPVVNAIAESGTYMGQITLEPAGRNVLLLVAGIRIYDEHGADLGVVLVFDDATEQARAQKVAAWREVARRIAHEIKNPITPIKLSAERLLRRYGRQFEGEDREVFETCISTILGQVDSLRELVNEFSKFARMPAVRTKYEDINQLLREIANFFSLSYTNINFDISHLDSTLPKIRVDREQLNRAIMNLVQNSVAALANTSGSKQITIFSRVVEPLNAVRIEIADNGCGIPPGDRDRAFEPYFSTKPEGTGLGLAIVKQVVTDHGGYVRIADFPPQGTKIMIDLPIGSGNDQSLS